MVNPIYIVATYSHDTFDKLIEVELLGETDVLDLLFSIFQVTDDYGNTVDDLKFINTLDEFIEYYDNHFSMYVGG